MLGLLYEKLGKEQQKDRIWNFYVIENFQKIDAKFKVRLHPSLPSLSDHYGSDIWQQTRQEYTQSHLQSIHDQVPPSHHHLISCLLVTHLNVLYCHLPQI